MTTTVVAALGLMAGGVAVNVRGARLHHIAIRTIGLGALIFALYTLATLLF